MLDDLENKHWNWPSTKNYPTFRNYTKKLGINIHKDLKEAKTILKKKILEILNKNEKTILALYGEEGEKFVNKTVIWINKVQKLAKAYFMYIFIFLIASFFLFAGYRIFIANPRAAEKAKQEEIAKAEAIERSIQKAKEECESINKVWEDNICYTFKENFSDLSAWGETNWYIHSSGGRAMLYGGGGANGVHGTLETNVEVTKGEKLEFSASGGCKGLKLFFNDKVVWDSNLLKTRDYKNQIIDIEETGRLNIKFVDYCQPYYSAAILEIFIK